MGTTRHSVCEFRLTCAGQAGSAGRWSYRIGPPVDGHARYSQILRDPFPRTAGFRVNEVMTMFALPPTPPISPMVIVRAFAPAPHNWLPAHRGLDLEARRGQSVVAPGSGRIVFADRIAARRVVVLKSGEVRFTFEPVRARVDVGQHMRPGQVLGRVDTGGHCDGRCLHWGAKIGGEYVDPLSFLPRPRPVLKPVSALAFMPPDALVRLGARARFPPVRSPAGSASP